MNEEVAQELSKHKRHADKLLTIFGSIFTGLFTVLVAAIFNLYQQEHRRFNELVPMRSQLNQIAVRMEAIPLVQTDIRRLIDNNLLTREQLLKLGNQIAQNRSQIDRLNNLVKALDDEQIQELQRYIEEIKERKRELLDEQK